MNACPYIHNSMVCITGDMLHVSSDVYIDSVKSDQSDVVSEEIEVDSDDADILSRVNMDDGIAVEELIGSNDGQTWKSSLSAGPLQLGAHQNAPAETVKTQTFADTSVNRVTNVIKKILFLRPNEDPEVAKAKTIKDLMASVEKEATTGLALPKETIIEIVSIKAPNRQKPKLTLTKGLTNSKVSLCGNKFSRELDTPSVSLLRSNCRTPSPVRIRTCSLSEIRALDHQNCYFDSLALKLTSKIDGVQAKSSENHRTSQKDGFFHTGLKDVVQETRTNSEGDDGNNVISNSCSVENETDLEVSGDTPDTKQTSDKCDGKFRSVHSVRNQFSNCLNDMTKDQQERERDRRPPFSYSQLIQMALSTKADKRMALREIYQWIENNFAYYRYSKNPGWKNSIRHSLSLCDAFVRKKISHSTGRSGSSYWTLDPDRLTAKNASCTTHFSEMNALPNRKCEADLISCAAKAVVRKRRSGVEVKQQMKQTKLFEQPNAVGVVGNFAAGFDVVADSSVIDDMLSVGSFNCGFQTVSGLLMEHETPDILADSTTEEVLGFTCASDFLCHRDRGTFVARQPDPMKPKVYRPHRRKQELKVLRSPSETDGYDQSKIDEEVTVSSRSFDEIACGEALVGEEVFWMETPESDELVLSLKDEDDITSMLFSPSGTSECLAQNLSWTSPVQDLAPVPSNASASVTPFGFENELTIAELDCMHNGKIPLQSSSDGAFCNVHNIARWLSDCYGGCPSAADGKLESQMFCNLPGSEEVTNLECDADSDFLDNLFSFPPGF